MEKIEVSQAVIRRLPRYYRHLEELEDIGVERISSSALAHRLHITASQIRQDLNCFGGFGQQGYGYNVTKLKNAIGEILDLDMPQDVILIGVGNLGRALLQNFDFTRRGCRVAAAFDTNEQLIGTTINGVEVKDAAGLIEYVKNNKPFVAVLTLPRKIAHETAEELVNAGIKAIWNFTNIDLNVEDRVVVENVHFGDSLMMLKYRMNH